MPEQHHHHHHHHHPHGSTSNGKLLLFSLLFTLLFAVIEAVTGWLSQSLALLGDAGHMLSDSVALALAALASWVALRPPTQRHSYGLQRFEVITALVNGLIMLLIVVAILVHALDRIAEPRAVASVPVMIVAGLGLIVNVVIILLLSRGQENLNIRAAMLHVMGDILGSVAALISGVVIYISGWYLVDPILSLFICAILLFSSVRLLREAMHVLMEGVPLHLDLKEVGDRLASHDASIVSVHDLHIWSLSSGRIALSAHLVLRDLSRWDSLLRDIEQMLQQQFGIDHTTLQPESMVVETVTFHNSKPS